MANLTVLNKNTVFRKLSNFLLVGALGFGVYLGTAVYNNHILNKKAEEVENAISSRDLELASRLLASFQENSSIRLEDRVKLELELEKQIGVERVEEKLKKDDVNAAYKIIAEFKSKKFYSDALIDRIDSLEKRTYDLTEEGLFKKLIGSKEQDKTILLERYLNLYPKGNNRNKVITEFLTTSFNKFLNNINNNKDDFNQLYHDLSNLNLVLEKYTNDKLPISHLINIDNIITQARETVDTLYTYYDANEKNIRIGSFVKTVPLPYSLTNYYVDYVNERESTIPSGSVGKIVGIDGNRVYVKFEDVINYKWKKDWGEALLNYWKDGKKNVGEYHPSELIIVNIITEIDKNKFYNELRKLKENFGYYK